MSFLTWCQELYGKFPKVWSETNINEIEMHCINISLSIIKTQVAKFIFNFTTVFKVNCKIKH